MLKQLLSEQEAVEEARRIINSVLGKRWMIAVWCVDEVEKKDEPNMLRLAGKTTWQFPQGDFEESLRLLRNCLHEETTAGKPPVPPPLKMASFLTLASEEERDDELQDLRSGNLRGKSLDDLFREKQGGEEE